MDVQELNKKQLILLTLLITFVVSIATGIITVSLMNQMPKSVPQTINNVIQRTIEKVTTVQVPTVDKTTNTVVEPKNNATLLFSDTDALVNIYSNSIKVITPVISSGDNTTSIEVTSNIEPVAIGQGIIISDIGLILVDSSILTEGDLYKVILNKIDFNASVLKKFNNGFTILKISQIPEKIPEKTDIPVKTQ